MANPDRPQGHPPDYSDIDDTSRTRIPDRSRLEQALVKNSRLKKQAPRDIENRPAAAAKEPGDRDARTAHLLNRLYAQLVERDGEIERLRQAVSELEDEMSRRSLAHGRELERRRAELERLQDAYDQFEKESDSLLSELSEQIERLREESHQQRPRLVLK